jgi:hypothetical protein
MTSEELIAPCGMNCALCRGYQREKNQCPGCNGPDKDKPGSCTTCKIVICEIRRESKTHQCIDCEKFPCQRLKDLDKRYRTKYGMSMLENLKTIEKEGMETFLKNQKDKWTCPKCGELLCVHDAVCMNCGGKNKYFPAS